MILILILILVGAGFLYSQRHLLIGLHQWVGTRARHTGGPAFKRTLDFLLRIFYRDPAALEYSHEEIANVIVDTVFQGLIPR